MKTTKFYKITNKTETHNGLKYHKGLVIDPPGGIYFTDVENILAFCWDGTNLREVFLPEDVQVYPPLDDAVSPREQTFMLVMMRLFDWKNPGEPKKWAADKAIIGKKFPLWTRETFEKLISEGADIHARDDEALRLASLYGHLEVVKLLLENGADVHAYGDLALRWASENGHVEVVKLLLENGADVHACDDLALRLASLNGHLEVVELLKGAM